MATSNDGANAKRLVVYLFNSDVSTAQEALSPPKPSKVIALTERSGLDGVFVFEPRAPQPPSWLKFVSPVLSEQPVGLLSASSAGALIIRVPQKDRFVAITFGFGRSLLDSSRFEANFGLRVALNRVDPDRIRSVDTKTFEDMVLTRRTQISRSSQIPAFDLDITRDILRSITGESRDSAFAKRLSGADGLYLNAEVEIGEIGARCAQLLDAFEDSTYRENFGWIDHLAVVRDVALVSALDDLVLLDLGSRRPETTHLAMPEPLDWQDIDWFEIGGTNRRGDHHPYDDLDLPEYLSVLGDRVVDITVEKLKARRVSVVFVRTGEADPRWRLYDCLVSEQVVDGRLYVLIEGRWFAVSRSIVEEVDTFCASLPEPLSALPDSTPGEDEGEYNARVGASSGGQLVVLDAKILRPPGAASGIEPCDLLSRRGEFIHVKRKSRSSTLSHLFAQGSVSTEVFLNDAGYRSKLRAAINERVPESDRLEWEALTPGELPHAKRQEYSVAYAVISDSKKEGFQCLPFFSRLNLMQRAQELNNMGIAVSLKKIGVTRGGSASS